MGDKVTREIRTGPSHEVGGEQSYGFTYCVLGQGTCPLLGAGKIVGTGARQTCGRDWPNFWGQMRANFCGQYSACFEGKRAEKLWNMAERTFRARAV